MVWSPRQVGRIFRTLDPRSASALGAHIYKRGGSYFYLSDNTRFINHSETGYNVSLIDDSTEVALRDIERGDELLENYYLLYDTDDPFVLEMQDIEVDKFLAMKARERKRYVKGQNISG